MNNFTICYKKKIVKAEVFATAVLLSTHPLKLRVVYTPEKTIEYIEIYWEDQQIEAVKETMREFIALSPGNTITSLRCNVELPDASEKPVTSKEEDASVSVKEGISEEPIATDLEETLKESIISTEVEDETTEDSTSSVKADVETFEELEGPTKECITTTEVEDITSEESAFSTEEKEETHEEPTSSTEANAVESSKESVTLLEAEEEEPKELITSSKVEEATKEPIESVKVEETRKEPDTSCEESEAKESKEKVYTPLEIDAILKGAYELLGYSNTAEQALKLAVDKSLQTFFVEAKTCDDKKLGPEKVPLAIVEVTNKFCEAEGIKIDSLLSLAISLSYIGAPSYADVYKAIAKIESKNVAMAKVEVTASFKRWIKQKHPAIAERYPDIEVKSLLNLFRDEECKF